MQAIIFDIDHTIFSADNVLHEGVAELLAILQSLGIKIGAISSADHRVLVRLDEAGIREFFESVRCGAHSDAPKSPAALNRILQELGAGLSQAALVSHAHSDILLGKEAGLARTIGISHGSQNAGPLKEASADHIVTNIPALLDVIQ